MTESVAMVPTAGKIGVSSSTPASAGLVPRKSPKLAFSLMLLLLAFAVGGGGWACFEGLQIVKAHEQARSGAPGGSAQRDMEFLMRVIRWQRATTLVTAVGGIVLIMITGYGFWSRRQGRVVQPISSELELKKQLRQLRSRLDAREQVVADMLEERERMFGQVTELTRAKSALDEELSQRRKVEKSLAQQRQELARSKDVLELHVQARTQELQKLQRRSELILDSAAEGICGFDLQGKITFANPAAARVMAMSVPEMVGRLEHELFPDFKAQTGASEKGTNRSQPTEVVATGADGSTFAAEYMRSPIHENGRVVGEVLIFKDVSERKQAAEMLAQRVAELARSNAELEQFAFVASHDLQEPLRKIQAFGDRLKTKCDEAKLESGRDYLERMQSAAARMQNLINDLLTFSRIIRRTEPFGPVNLTHITHEVLGDLEVRIEKSRAVIELGDLPMIEGDAMQIRQLLQNLIGNALKFQKPGTAPVVQIRGQLVVQPSGRGSTAIFTRQSADGGKVSLGEAFCELTVQDNGIGFDEKYLEKIFAVFTRLHGRQEYEGTGIGLAVCQRIVDRHGGTITARSTPGEGATFIVRLPVKQSSQPAQSA